MQSSLVDMKCRFVFYVPTIKYELNSEEQRYIKVVDPVGSNPQCLNAVVKTVDQQFLDTLKECSDMFAENTVEIYDDPEDSIFAQVDLKEWQEPFSELLFDQDMPEFTAKFFVKLVTDHLKIIRTATDTKWIESFSDSYSFLKMTRSLMSILKIDESQKIGLQEHLDKKYPQILMLMNLNGSVAYRTKQLIKFTKTEENMKVTQKRHVTFMKIKGVSTYFRDGHLTFLESLMQHPRVKFAFNSSMMRKNILPVVTKIFESKMYLVQEHMMKIFDQEYSEKSPEVTGEPYGFIKNLDKILMSEECQQNEANFGEHNTLIIDTDEIDVYNCHKNALIMQKVTENDIWPLKNESYTDQFQILADVRKDIFEILDKCQDDMQIHLKDKVGAEHVLCDHIRKANKLQPKGLKKDSETDLVKEFEDKVKI